MDALVNALAARIAIVALFIGLPAFAAEAPPVAARADRRPQELGLFVGAGYLASPGANGGAFSFGLRLGMGRYVALSFDVGYGVVGASPTVEDRWWLMPAVALVLPAGPVRFDLGAGLGLGASSGYRSWPDYVAGPFNPIWAFQLVPTVRAHVRAAIALRRCCDLFARVDVASLLLDGNSIGFRVGDPHRPVMDTLWFYLWIGVQFRLL